MYPFASHPKPIYCHLVESAQSHIVSNRGSVCVVCELLPHEDHVVLHQWMRWLDDVCASGLLFRANVEITTPSMVMIFVDLFIFFASSLSGFHSARSNVDLSIYPIKSSWIDLQVVWLFYRPSFASTPVFIQVGITEWFVVIKNLTYKHAFLDDHSTSAITTVQVPIPD